MDSKLSALGTFLLILTYTNASECDKEITCPGRRPRDENGCCPLLKGEECVENEMRQCDEILGYSCVNGICLGRFNITAIEIGTTHVELTWNDFIPEVYHYEYSVMYSMKFDEDLQNWDRHEFGTEPHIILRDVDLVPDQWYYIRVGTWDEPELFTFLNLTETLVVKTKALDHCLYDDRRVGVNETIIIECMEICACLSTGVFTCSSVCPRGETETPVCDDNMGPEDYCCEFVEHCVTASNCQYQNDQFEHGESWLIDCLENCTCSDGVVTCYGVCGGHDPSHCLQEEFRNMNQGCCQTYLDCTEKDALKSEETNMPSQETPDHKSATLPLSGTKAPFRSETKQNNTEISFTVDKASSTFAVLRWIIPNNVVLRNCTLVVKYRALSDPDWSYTNALQANSTRCMLKCLKSSSWYMAELMYLEDFTTLGMTFFNTTRIKDTTDFHLRPKISANEIQATSIHITWESNELWNNSDIVYIEIYWIKSSDSDDQRAMQNCVDKDTKQFVIESLTPQTMYIVWIGIILETSKVIYSNPLHFVTTVVSESFSSFHEHSKIIAIAISCTSVVILFLTFISVVYIVKYRRRHSFRRPETAFENKIFQIH